MNKTISLLASIAECHSQLKDHAKKLRSDPKVVSVVHWTDMTNLANGVRLEESVDAELNSGEALSWCIQLQVNSAGIEVEADIRRIHRDGQDLVIQISQRCWNDCEGATSEVSDIVQDLCTTEVDFGG